MQPSDKSASKGFPKLRTHKYSKSSPKISPRFSDFFASTEAADQEDDSLKNEGLEGRLPNHNIELSSFDVSTNAESKININSSNMTTKSCKSASKSPKSIKKSFVLDRERLESHNILMPPKISLSDDEGAIMSHPARWQDGQHLQYYKDFREKATLFADQIIAASAKMTQKTIETGRYCMQLLSHDKVFLWQNDNPHLKNWHRPVLNNTYECFKSIFAIHTETLNIWTHLIGGSIMIYLWIYYTLNLSNNVFHTDLFMHIFFVFSVFCMCSSSIFHMMMCHSEPIKIFLNKLDYIGIILMIFGSSIPVQYFYFYCHPWLQTFYMVINIITSFVLFGIVTKDSLQAPEYLNIRLAVFLFYGFFSVVPVTHYSYLQKYYAHQMDSRLMHIMLMGIVYSLGSIFYSMYIPERCFPGKCDILINSHQIMHICVVVAAIIHYYTLTHFARIIPNVKCL